MRGTNCYDSNPIEGHDTHPIDIEQELKNDYEGGGLKGERALKVEGICEIHQGSCRLLPEDLLWVQDPTSKERLRLVPGQLRRRDVKVGQLVPESPGALPRFLERFEQVYGSLGKTVSIFSSAAAHHRLLWIHPFLDGNGRGRPADLTRNAAGHFGCGGVWSVARGLARNAGEYKTLVAHCDLTRRNDLDGRGALSEEALAEFIRFFLTTCIDQVAFIWRGFFSRVICAPA